MVFESSVISYGSKTVFDCLVFNCTFESSVISYGSKTQYDFSNDKELV